MFEIVGAASFAFVGAFAVAALVKVRQAAKAVAAEAAPGDEADNRWAARWLTAWCLVLLLVGVSGVADCVSQIL